MTIDIQVTTANCGNEILGPKAAAQLIEQAKASGLMIINYQEMHRGKSEKEIGSLLALQSASKPNPKPQLAVVYSKTRETTTKANTLFSNTGMGSFVLFDKTKYRSVSFDPTFQEEPGNEGFLSNKGAVVSRLIVEDLAGNKKNILVISGHLDSNSHSIRVKNWIAIREILNPQAENWNDLAANIPDAVVAGYDANTRSIVPPGTPKATRLERDQVTNLWHVMQVLDPRIAAFSLAPLGDQREHFYSDEDTYKLKLNADGVPYKDYKSETSSKRSEYANAGSLDHVIIQDNTHLPNPDLAASPQRYRKAPINLQVEPRASERDHNIIGSPVVSLADEVNEFNRVKIHIIKQLRQAHPQLVNHLIYLTDSPESRALLLNAYNLYLSPQGELNRAISLIDPANPDVTPASLRLTDLNREHYQELEGIKTQCKAALEEVDKLEHKILSERALLDELIKTEKPTGVINKKLEDIKQLMGEIAPLYEKKEKTEAFYRQKINEIVGARLNEAMQQRTAKNSATDTMSTDKLGGLKVEVGEEVSPTKFSFRTSFGSLFSPRKESASLLSPASSIGSELSSPQSKLSTPNSKLSSPGRESFSIEEEPSSPQSESRESRASSPDSEPSGPSTPQRESSSSKMDLYIQGFRKALTEIPSQKVLESWVKHVKAFDGVYKAMVKNIGKEAAEEIFDKLVKEKEALLAAEQQPGPLTPG